MAIFKDLVHNIPMSIALPSIIQGGMGAGVSHWRLARTVSQLGQLGVVSGTALDQIMARRLQEGDADGSMRRALKHFPFPRVAQRILDTFFIQGGKKPDTPYVITGAHTHHGRRWLHELCIAGNFAEVFLAREGHDNPVGINYLEKIQLPHLPSLYGAMLAGVAVVIVGAGIPVEMPGVLDALAQHQPVSYPLYVSGAVAGERHRMTFDPGDFDSSDAIMPEIRRPAFLPIVASDALATMLARKSNGVVNGFVIEAPSAGGHNAPPRGQMTLTPDGQPVYGPRDNVNLAVMRQLGYPFWLAGSYGSPAQYRAALDQGASGIQVGTAFALCRESGLDTKIRKELVRQALTGAVRVFTDPVASPTGFPFKVAELEGTLSEDSVYRQRRRICDLGFLRTVYRKADGTLGYRCAAEPEAGFLAKGGKPEELIGRKCLCNALVANVGMPQVLANGSTEPCLITLGDDWQNIGRFCTMENPEFSAADVIKTLLGA